MGQQQSKDELLYQQVNYGNIEGIRALRTEGAGLEWIDKEGKTPLILACMNPELYNVAKTLIELGANVNAYRPGRHAGTPLHHAAKRGLEQTVKLLLSHGANALVMNDDCQTPLDIARTKGCSNVVRTIEGHVCLFSGWLRELYGPGFLELLAPQLLSRKVWVVILPCGSRNPRKPFKLELAIYAGPQDGQPRTIVPLWKANLEESNFDKPEPTAIISDVSRIPRRWRRRRAIKSSQEARCTRIKLAPLHESGKQELQQFCNACKGIPQVMHPTFPFNCPIPTAPAFAQPTIEDEQLAMAINASLSASQERPNMYVGSALDASTSSSNSSMNTPSHQESFLAGQSSSSAPAHVSKCEVHKDVPGPSGIPPQPMQIDNSISSVVQTALETPPMVSIPSAPPAVNAVATDDGPIVDGPIEYPSIDVSPVDLPYPDGGVGENGQDGSPSCCTICLDAPLEGACVPCGHMAGCMSCLNEIKAKKWGCPVCRSKIDQVIRIYAV